MKKLDFLIGLGIGFILGSRAGSEPYEQLEAKVRSVASRPEVRDTVDKAKSTAQSKVEETAKRVAEKVPGMGASSNQGEASDGQRTA